MYHIWNRRNSTKRIPCKSIASSFSNPACTYNNMLSDTCMMSKTDKVVKSNSDTCIRENYTLPRVERVFGRSKIKRLPSEWELVWRAIIQNRMLSEVKVFTECQKFRKGSIVVHLAVYLTDVIHTNTGRFQIRWHKWSRHDKDSLNTRLYRHYTYLLSNHLDIRT